MDWNREKVKQLRAQFPKGTKVKLNFMDDEFPIKPGTIGTVWFVDDAGTIHVEWAGGSSLGLIYGEDDFEVVE